MAIHSSDKSSTKTNHRKKLPPVNILSVDFDWIMEPTIEAYNKFTRGGGHNDWALIKQIMPGLQPKGDLYKYYELTVYLTNIAKKINNPDHFRTASNHMDIIECMRDEWNLTKTPYILYNIDHHHDCGYNKPYEEIKQQDTTSANWVIKLQDICPKMKQYFWLNNSNSDLNFDEATSDNLPRLMTSTDLNVLGYVNFDYIFICSSPGWTPPEYIPLFDTLVFSLDRLLN